LDFCQVEETVYSLDTSEAENWVAPTAFVWVLMSDATMELHWVDYLVSF
jgi:hypothetical protein